MVHAGEGFHEILAKIMVLFRSFFASRRGQEWTYPDFFPFVIITFEEISMMLYWNYAGTTEADFWFRREGEVRSRCQRDDRGNGRDTGVLLMAERAVVKDAVQLLIIGYSSVAEVNF